MQKKAIVLASESPRRKEILQEMGLTFSIEPAEVDESAVKGSTPSKLTKNLSLTKARATLIAHGERMTNRVGEYKDDFAVIGADTVVVLGKEILGKPKDCEDAVKMLLKLSGKWHKVYTGTTVIVGDKTLSFCVRSSVRFKKLTFDSAKAYVDKCNPLDKAGAYGIQDKEVVKKYRGSYTNIVGLPKEKLARVLRRAEVI